jgi:hypothetical protein
MKLITSAFILSLLSTQAIATNTPKEAYRNALEKAPQSWQGPKFELSHNYPKKQPAVCNTTDCPWLAIDLPMKVDFSDAGVPSWRKDGVYNQYIMSILDYVKQDQSLTLSNESGFNADPQGDTQWFHVPWMAFNKTSGREYVHGLTNERTAVISDFHGEERIGLHALPGGKSAEEAGFETWAVGMYNQIGGYTIGQGWNDKGEPVIETVKGITSTKGMPFIEGTVVVKFLFTTATPTDVHYLANSPVWQADRHVEKGNNFTCAREVQEVRLVQVDVAVVDSRSPTNWVYGTFAYIDGKGETPWDNLQPVGLQWGMDSWTFPAVPKSASLKPRQSVLNKSITAIEHYGCNGRLAGPVDNKKSSCLSCHGGAFTNEAGYTFDQGTYSPPIFGFDGLCEEYSQDNVEYFQTIKYPQDYTGGNYANLMNMDTSLQMQIALQQWALFKNDGKAPSCELEK